MLAELQDNVLHRTTQPAFGVLLRLHPGRQLRPAGSRLDRPKRTRSAGQREKKGRLVRLMPAGTLLPLPARSACAAPDFLRSADSRDSRTDMRQSGRAGAGTRGRARHGVAIRLSIGADRFRLIRQLLTESAILAAGGGMGGFPRGLRDLTTWCEEPERIPFPILFGDAPGMGPDLRVALFACALSASCGGGLRAAARAGDHAPGPDARDEGQPERGSGSLPPAGPAQPVRGVAGGRGHDAGAHDGLLHRRYSIWARKQSRVSTLGPFPFFSIDPQAGRFERE